MSPARPRRRCGQRPVLGALVLLWLGSCVILLARACVVLCRRQLAGARLLVERGEQSEPARVLPAPNSSTLVLMVDSRRPGNGSASYLAFAAAANAAYAERHGYDFLYVLPAGVEADAAAADSGNTAAEGLAPAQWRVKQAPGCPHATLPGAQRARPWCKLPVVWEALGPGGWETVVYVDSDAVIFPNGRSVDGLLAAGGHSAWSVLAGASPSVAGLVFMGDGPSYRPHHAEWARLPNSGLFIAQRARGGRDMVRAWWDVPAINHSAVHPFEQCALWAALYRVVEAPSSSPAPARGRAQPPQPAAELLPAELRDCSGGQLGRPADAAVLTLDRVSVVDELPFALRGKPGRPRWAQHAHSFNPPKIRALMVRAVANTAGLGEVPAVQAVLSGLRARGRIVELDVVAATARMRAASDP